MSMAGGILNTVGSIGGGIAGTIANNNAQKQQSQMEFMNALLQMNQNDQSNKAALRNLQMQMMGTTDGSGTRTVYDPDRGWRVFMSPGQEQIMRGQESEQIKSIFNDAAANRAVNDREYGDSWDAAQIVDNLTREFNQAPRVTATEERARTMGDALTGLNGAFDEATNTAVRGALRNGSTDITRLLADMAKSRASGVGEVIENAGSKARTSAVQQTNANRNNLATLLHSFGQKAGKGYGGRYQPMNTNTEGTTGNSAQLTNSAMAQLLATLKGNKAPQMDSSHIKPNMGIGNTIAQGFGALGNLADRYYGIDNGKTNNRGW